LGVSRINGNLPHSCGICIPEKHPSGGMRRGNYSRRFNGGSFSPNLEFPDA
jgi:hypothetical protein